MNPKLARMLVIAGLTGTPFLESGLFAEGDDPGGGGGGPPKDDKRFTQADLDAAVQARLAREAKARDKAIEDAKAEGAKRTGELEKQLADLTARLEDAGKQGAEKERAQLERELKAARQAAADAVKERDEAFAARDKAALAHRDHVVNSKLGEALLASKALPEAVAQAVRSMRAEAEIDVDDAGKVTVTIDGRVYDDLAKASTAWLEKSPWLRAHPGGGSGTKNNGSGRRGGPAGDDMDENALIAEAAREMARSAGIGRDLSMDADLK